MIGVVYRINFPDGCFYIGSSEQLGTRIDNHYHGGTYVTKKIKAFFSCSNDLWEAVTVEYKGKHYRREEKNLIFSLKDSKNMINKMIADPNKVVLKSEYLIIVDQLRSNGFKGYKAKDICRCARRAFVHTIKGNLKGWPSKEKKAKLVKRIYKVNKITLLNRYYAHIEKLGYDQGK